MKAILATLTFCLVCSCTHSEFASADNNNNNSQLVGRVVKVHLDLNAQEVIGTLVSVSDTIVSLRLTNGKLYQYPLHRLAGIEEL